MATDNLEITEVANNQADEYLVVNEGLSILDRAIAGRLVIDFAADSSYSISTTEGSEEWRDKFIQFTDTGVVLTGGVDVIFPAKNGPEYIVTNSTAQTLTLKISGETGVALSASSTSRFYYNGTDIVAAP